VSIVKFATVLFNPEYRKAGELWKTGGLMKVKA
jgi:hypothetical protein